MAQTVYKENNLTEEQKKQVQELEGAYKAAQLPSYQAQADSVDRVQDAAINARIAALKSAYESNSATLEAEKTEIPAVYQKQKNAAAAQSELARKNFGEYASASGLSSGAGGQARLAMTNQLQGELASLGEQEAAERRRLDSQIAQLKLSYRNDISAAIAQGEYERAAALLEEYRRAEESAVTTAQAQADENYRAWQAQADENYRAWQAGQALRQWEDETAYRDAQAAQSQANWQAQFDYSKQRDALERQLEEYQNRLKLAELQAKYDKEASASGSAGGTGTASGSGGSKFDQTESVINNAPENTDKASGTGSASTGFNLSGSVKNNLVQNVVNAAAGQTAAKKQENTDIPPGKGLSGTWVKSLRERLITALEENRFDAVEISLDAKWAEMTTAQRNMFRNMLRGYGLEYTYGG